MFSISKDYIVASKIGCFGTSYGPHKIKCEICGEEKSVRGEYVYHRGEKYFCSYNCMMKYDKSSEKSKETLIALENWKRNLSRARNWAAKCRFQVKKFQEKVNTLDKDTRSYKRAKLALNRWLKEQETAESWIKEKENEKP